MNNKIFKLRIILWSILGITVLWFFFMAIVPSGKISYTYYPGENNYFIKKLTPAERVEYGEGIVKIIGDPAYFSLQTPRRFEKAKLTMKYKIAGTGRCYTPAECGSIIEAGILTDKKIWQYNLEPIENSALDYLMERWHMIREKNIVLLQKNKKYEKISDFLKTPPLSEKIAVYNYDFKNEFLLKNYKAGEGITINKPLRGAYQIYTYLKNEDLDFDFSIFDLNRNKDADDFDLYLHYNGQIIASRHLDDDGNITEDGKISGLKKIKLSVPNLPEGIYRIELKANNDLVTKEIKTKQNKLSFLDKIWLFDKAGENITLYTDSKEIYISTINPGRLQDIKVNGENLAIKETYKQFSLRTKEKISEIKLKKDDLILAGGGVFSFATSSLINSSLKKVDINFNSEDAEYIIAEYKQPREEVGWRIAEAEFDLTNAYSEKNKFNFLISVPGLRADDNIQDSVIIKEIKINVEGRNLWKFLSKFI
jgi:stress response protein SCP2